MEEEYPPLTLFNQYHEIQTCCSNIKLYLQNNSLEDALQELKNCSKKLNDLVNEQPHLLMFYVAFVNTMQQQISHQISQINGIIEKTRAVSSNTITSNTSSNSPSCSANASQEDLKGSHTDQGFQTIAGLQEIKSALISHVVLPFKQPQLFKGLKMNCILLFGPPGTGKTKLVAATAVEAGAKLMSITSSDILSPYIGESEKFIAKTFQQIKTSGEPTILFIDEIDSLCRSRRENEADHSRRIKTEFLCQLSNFTEIPNVYLICATNCPWQLDNAFKRRFQRHLFIPLPNAEERYQLFKLFVRNTTLERVDHLTETVVARTVGYSGSDIERFVSQALVRSVERLQSTDLWKKLKDDTYVPCSSNVLNGPWVDLHVGSIQDLPPNSVRLPQVQEEDVLEALAESRPSITAEEYRKYENYVK